MSQAESKRVPRWPSIGAAGISAAVFGLWLGIVSTQNHLEDADRARYLFVGLMLLSLPVLAVAGTLATAPTRRLALLAAAASGMLVWGLLALLSVGLLLLAASVLGWIAVISAGRAGGDRTRATLAAVVMVMLPVAYLATL